MLEKKLEMINNMLFTSLFVSSIFFGAAVAEVGVEPEVANKATASVSNWHVRNGMRIQRNWGVDVIGVRSAANGFMLAFRYRVVDVEKAKLLNDKRSKAYLIDEATGNVLGIPIMEKMGELRQKTPPERNRNYFIMFGNPGKLVKSGSRVSVVVGEFRIEGLVVD